MRKANEPSNAAIRASYKIGANVRLARAIFPTLSFGTYDAYSAHRWALKLIEVQPETALGAVVALVNFDWMVDGAVEQFQAGRGQNVKRYPRVIAAFKAWQADEAKRALPAAA